jgi:hypothetical protein
MPTKPIIVIAYDDNTRKSLINSLTPFGVLSVPCETFCEAENLMLNDLFQGIVVDLTSMVKAKGEEKTVACSLTGFFPTLRVRAMGPMIIPMAMAGDAKQDKSLADFIKNTCVAFAPRKLRAHKRRELFLPTIIKSDVGEDEIRVCTLNISWGGMFIIDMNPDRYRLNEMLEVKLPDFKLQLEAEVLWVNAWGHRKAPGIGVGFNALDEKLEQTLAALLKTNKLNDRDRLLA